MTRKSKREIESAVDSFEDTTSDVPKAVRIHREVVGPDGELTDTATRVIAVDA